jgi:hypothetical protein
MGKKTMYKSSDWNTLSKQVTKKTQASNEAEYKNRPYLVNTVLYIFGFQQCGEFLEWLNNYSTLLRDSTLWS